MRFSTSQPSLRRHSSLMQRPGPLRELPLEPFLLPLNPEAAASSKQTRSNKRQLSPARPSLFSPTKRRILNDEGIHLPEKSIKTPLPPSRTSNTASSVRFTHIHKDPDSPARVLNFGLPKNLQGDPQKRSAHKGPTMNMAISQELSSSSSRLVPSPELNPKTTIRTSTRRSQDVQSYDYSSSEGVPISSSSASAVVTSFVPRELPPQTDPRSIHFPGFFVYQDTHVAIHPTVVMEVNEECQRDSVVDPDTHKENLPPRRKTKKLSAASNTSEMKTNPDASDRSGITTDGLNMSYDTPKKISTRTELSSTAPKTMLRISSPRSSPAGGRKALRQTMKDEMDLDENKSDDNA